jgi:hypothetical protein
MVLKWISVWASDWLSRILLEYIVAYLPQAREVEPQNQLFLSNTRTNNGTEGLRNSFLGYGSVSILPRRRMTSHSSSTDWESRDLSSAWYSWRYSRTRCSVGGRCEGYIKRLIIFYFDFDFNFDFRVEAGSNTSTITLRVVVGTKREVSNLRQ